MQYGNNAIELTDDEIVRRAQQIVASRIAIPVEQGKPFKLNDGTNTDELRRYLALTMANHDVEHFNALYFTPDGRLIKMVEIAKGTDREVLPSTREVARQGLLCNASFVAVAHNHPNWDKRPSPADQENTMRMAEACASVGLQMTYAFVVGGPRIEDIVPIEPPKPNPRDAILGLLGALREARGE